MLFTSAQTKGSSAIHQAKKKSFLPTSGTCGVLATPTKQPAAAWSFDGRMLRANSPQRFPNIVGITVMPARQHPRDMRCGKDVPIQPERSRGNCRKLYRRFLTRAPETWKDGKRPGLFAFTLLAVSASHLKAAGLVLLKTGARQRRSLPP